MDGAMPRVYRGDVLECPKVLPDQSRAIDHAGGTVTCLVSLDPGYSSIRKKNIGHRGTGRNIHATVLGGLQRGQDQRTGIDAPFLQVDCRLIHVTQSRFEVFFRLDKCSSRAPGRPVPHG